MNKDALAQEIRKNLTPDLLKQQFKRQIECGAHPMTGYCYVASETFYHATGGRFGEWRPRRIVHEGVSHWYLVSLKTKEVLDLTADQFHDIPDYSKGKGAAFISQLPSNRCKTLLGRITDGQERIH